MMLVATRPQSLLAARPAAKRPSRAAGPVKTVAIAARDERSDDEDERTSGVLSGEWAPTWCVSRRFGAWASSQTRWKGLQAGALRCPEGQEPCPSRPLCPSVRQPSLAYLAASSPATQYRAAEPSFSSPAVPTN